MRKIEKPKARWNSLKRKEIRDKGEKPEKQRLDIKLKAHRDLQEDLRKKRKQRAENRQVLIDKGVLKV